MDFSIECPICEEKFSVPSGPPEQQITCPCCSKSFQLSSVVPSGPPAKPSASVPHATRVAPKQRLATPTVANVNDHPDRPKKTEGLFDATQPPSLNEIQKQNKHRRDRGKALKALATAGFLLITIGVLAVLLYLQVQNQTFSLNLNDATELSEIDVPAEERLPAEDSTSTQTPRQPSPQTQQQRRSRRGPIDPPVPPKQVKLADLPEQQFSYHTKKTVDECWKIVQPHLVSLKVFDSRGTHHASAMLIDSRGWIVTSYHAVANASKIEVTACALSIDELPNPDLLTDLVRGVIAVDPVRDIAILSINRRFVVSFAEIQIDETNNLVAGQHLLQSAPPSTDNPYARYEVKIKSRVAFDQLKPEAQEIARRYDLSDPQLAWLVTPYESAPTPGTPLVLIDGTLGAIHAFNTNQLAYYITIAELKKLIASADDNVQPLSTLGSSDDQDSLTAIADNHPMRDVSVRLNQLGTACENFGWAPDTQSEYKRLQEFSKTTTKALRFTIENRDVRPERDQVKKIEDQVKHWEQSLARHLGKLQHDDSHSLTKMNEFAEIEIKNNLQYVPFYGKVLMSGFELPDYVILEMENTEIIVNIPQDVEAGPPMLPGSHWLFFIKTPATRKAIKFNAAGKTMTTESAGLLFSVGPIN